MCRGTVRMRLLLLTLKKVFWNIYCTSNFRLIIPPKFAYVLFRPRTCSLMSWVKTLCTNRVFLPNFNSFFSALQSHSSSCNRINTNSFPRFTFCCSCFYFKCCYNLFLFILPIVLHVIVRFFTNGRV